jgi:hypothetical protein
MSALTRILNNQIFNSTIIASQKIAAGTITGSLFASNVTVPGDFLITGNLFVLGTSAYTTVASTNTYVNDPLIVLNNGFAGTNTYDEGFIFNRGSLQNRALIWSEYFQEFRLIGTTETGTAYGNVAVSNYANLHLGNIEAQYTATIRGNIDQTLTGIYGATFAGNVALNGPYVTTSQANISLFNTGATQINFGEAANISMGASVGTTAIRNATLSLPYGTALTTGQTTFNLLNTTATTVNAFGAATALTMGAATGVAALNNANIWLPNATTVGNGQDTLNLFNLPATVSAFRSGTVVLLGASSGLLQINNPTIDATQSTVTLLNANVTVLNGLGAATTVNLGSTSGIFQINNPTIAATQSTVNLLNANVTTLNFAGAATTITAGAATGLASIRNQVINFPNLTNMVTDQTSINVFNANVTTLNLAGAGTTVTIGATTGNTVIRTADTFFQGVANVNATRDATTTTSAALTVAGGAAVKAGMIVGGTFYANASAGSTQQNSGIGAVVIPTGGISVGGTANIAGVTVIGGATQLNSTLGVGGITTFTNSTNATSTSDGAVRIQGGASVSKDLYVGGNLYAANIIGVTANVITVQDPLLFLAPDYTFPYNYDIGFYSAFTGNGLTTAGNVLQHTAVVRNEQTNTWTFASNLQLPGGGHVVFDNNTVYDPIKAGNLELTVTTAATSATTGALIVAGGAGIGGNIFHTGTQLQTSASNYIFATTPTTVDAFKAATDLEIGATSGTFTINNPTVVGSQTTLTLFNTVADTINFGRAANITLGINAGTTTVQGNLTIQSVRKSTVYNDGALTISGGLGVDGNIFINDRYLDTAQSSALVFNTPTTIDAFKAGTDIEIGATSGTVLINNPTVVGSQATQALYDTVTATLNFARAANITMGHTDGTTTLQGNANIRSITTSINSATGALKVMGGVGVRGNLNIAGDNTGSAYSGRGALTVGLDVAGGVLYPENPVQITANANSAARISIQNISTSQLARSEFIASADNGSNVSNFIITGITSSGFNSTVISPAIKPNDGYTYTTGNLVLSGSTDVVITSGGASSVGIRVSASNSNVGVQYSTESTTEKTGAFTVVGGAGIGKDLYVGKGATFNTLNDINPFKVNSSTVGNVAIFANVSTTLGATTEYVVVGGGNTVVQPGVTLKVGSVSSMMIPVGPTGARPSSLFGNAAYDVAGMIRFNSTINNLEFYDGSTWQVTGSTFTVISGRQFSGNVAGGFGNVDGTNTTFTLQGTATTASTIISINGVMQFPTLAYSVSGDQLVFTEPPAPGDVIDARILVTTTTVASIANGNGANQFLADDSGLNLYTGPSGGSVNRINIDTGGNINILAGSTVIYNQTPTQVTNTNLTLLDSFSANSYSTAKYVISMKQDTGNVQAMEALLTQSTVGSTAGTAYITTYGIVNTGNTMGTLAANVDVSGSWKVNMWLVPNAGTAISNVKVMTTYIV